LLHNIIFDERETMLTRDQILSAQDKPIETVDVPEWGGQVCVRTMGAKERDQWQDSMMEGKGKNRKMNLANITASLCVLCMSDENGALLFSRADVAALGEKSAAAMQRVFNAAARLNGITEEDIEELAKNSEPTESDASNSD